MYKCLKNVCCWLIFSSLWSLLSVLSSLENSSFKPPNLSFEDLSRFLKKFDERIKTSCHPKDSIAFKRPVGEKPTQLIVVEEEGNVLLQRVQCAGNQFMVLLLTCLLVIYILCLRYGDLFLTLVELFITSVRVCNWRSCYWGLQFTLSLIWQGVRYLVYLNSLLSTKQRFWILCLVGVLFILKTFKSKGYDGLIHLLPIICTLFIYALGLYLCSPKIINIVVYMLGNWFHMIWAAFILWRYYDYPDSDENDWLSVETSFLLEFCLVISIFKCATGIPIVGKIATLHICSIISSIGITCIFLHYLLARRLYKQGTGMNSMPLGNLKQWILQGMDQAVFVLFGWHKFFSGRAANPSNSGAKLQKLVGRIHGALCAILGPELGISHEKYQLLTRALKWLKMLPQLVLILFPSFVTKFYYDYCTLLTPGIKIAIMPMDASQPTKINALALCFGAQLARLLDPFLIRILPLYTVTRLVQVAALDLLVTATLAQKQAKNIE
ncbi:hypothetical protein BdWA1_000147 [Babesia duncani]|uniref:Uncharacterized protein n=1 Tax=Babesia duncani TaxID=323732 RepID=A0AAD9PLR6_9APIC|nr:hypothetical protein BdWA1_000147 [Babesia duncani]